MASQGLFTGCGPPSQLYPKVITADAKILHKCKYLGEVTGSSGEHIPSAWRGETASVQIQIDNAKVRAIDEAAELGATHIVWAGDTSSGYKIQMKARAYKCK